MILNLKCTYREVELLVNDSMAKHFMKRTNIS